MAVPGSAGTARGTRRRRLGIRARIVIAVTAVGILAASVTAAVLLISTRQIVLESRQNSILSTFSDQIDRSVAELPNEASGNPWALQTGRLPDTTVVWVRPDGQNTNEALRDRLPEAFLDEVGASQGDMRYLRTTLDGRPVFMVGQLIDPPSSAVPLAVVSVYPLGGQVAELEALLTAGVVITLVVGVAGGGVGLLVGRRISRPLTLLRSRVGAVGEGVPMPSGSTGSPDVDEVQTEFLAAAARLDASNARLAEQEARARQLVADVSHELRTPLTSMLAYSEILDDVERADPEELALAAHGTAAGVRRLTVLTEALLDMSRRDAGMARTELTDVALGPLLADVVAAAERAAGGGSGTTAGTSADGGPASRGVTVEVGEPIVLRTDERRLAAIVANLVANALRHGRPPVVVSTSRDETTVTVTVCDAGDGVPAEHAERVFERFVRLDTARGSTGESNGLGLAIARENARQLGGDVVLGRDGELTVAVLTLPVGPGPSRGGAPGRADVPCDRHDDGPR
ncbi:sensor histidine kinase [Mycetocola reblochoni]|uniref:histidine kinase n=2 Tax=Mycetocola reblochoni TaxID=331618 RepID=A0A1R4KBY6_9MICO|nr:HAMP domain-containing sensor histidine kinase [Mycetocola reblochoni]RLP68553.1 sensor histidine kinase [Mycetocola reblochoni]SJN41830.1 two-component system sensor kinase [Mycetocola reblochoni REB411]